LAIGHATLVIAARLPPPFGPTRPLFGTRRNAEAFQRHPPTLILNNACPFPLPLRSGHYRQSSGMTPIDHSNRTVSVNVHWLASSQWHPATFSPLHTRPKKCTSGFVSRRRPQMSGMMRNPSRTERLRPQSSMRATSPARFFPNTVWKSLLNNQAHATIGHGRVASIVHRVGKRACKAAPRTGHSFEEYSAIAELLGPSTTKADGMPGHLFFADQLS